MPSRLVRELMNLGSPITTTPSDTVHAAARLMDEAKCGGLAVMEKDRLVGILTERDIVRRVVAAGRNPQETKLAEVMTADPDAVSPETTIEDVVRKMDEFRYQYLPVVEDGLLVAVISLSDIPIEILSQLSGEIEKRHGLTERIW
jgi:CBS domain-containing protein